MRTIDPIQAEEQFRSKLREAGLIPPDGIASDGKLHRIDVEDEKPGKKSGFYVYHSDGIPAGAYGDWHDGEDAWKTWCAFDVGERSREEYEQHKRRLDAARAARTQAEKEQRQEAQARARRIWESAPACEEHIYLTRKGVKSFGLRTVGDRIVIPLCDRDGQIHSLEFIDAQGAKLFLVGGRKAGCWFGLGEVGGIICVAEGYATAASIHEATGLHVAVAFDCGNLPSVAKQLRELHPTARIVICADDDRKTKGNPGTAAAAKAAQQSNALIAVPDLPNGGDFNDQHALKGAQSVADTINAAIASDQGPIEAADLFPMVMQEIIDRKEGKSKNALRTGIKSVDNLTRGLQLGYVTVVGGLPGTGKTAAAIGIIMHNASNGVPCLLFSIEMDRIAIGVRFLSQNSFVPAVDIFDERIPLDSERLRWDDITSANGRMEKLLLTVDDRPHTLAEIVDVSHTWFANKVRAAGHKTGLIAVDYLGLISSDKESENRNMEVAKLCRGLKVLARTLHVSMLLCAQLNRSVNKRGGEPEMSDLRDSGEIEAVCDLGIFPWPWPREKVENGRGELELRKRPMKADEKEDPDVWLIRKNRNGPTGAALVKWEPELMRYTGLARETDVPPRPYQNRHEDTRQRCPCDDPGAPDARPSWQDREE